jgi:endoglucanase
MPRSCRANLALACALLCAAVPLSAGIADAHAQDLPDLYPEAVPALQPAPDVGPVPDLAPVSGQDPTPAKPRDCGTASPSTGPPGVDARGADPASPNPLRGLRWFVDPREPAWRSYASYRRSGARRNAELMWHIAREPRFRWFGRWSTPDVRKKVADYLSCAAALQPGAVPLVVVMRHQGKACSAAYTAGGHAEDVRTMRWYERFAAGVGDARVIIGFEPDSLGTLDCLAGLRRAARLRVLRHGVDVLTRLPNATVYLEAGASDWEPAARTARQLRAIGIHKARGFMLNVTHHDWTAANIRHGLAISRRTGGKPFIINTSYNGRGPVHYRKWIDRARRKWRRINVWCHPPRRGLGIRPTTRTHHPKVDAYMWINRPGYSAGACNGGPLPVGTWWPQRALMYARFATSWLGPPRGTRNGY